MDISYVMQDILTFYQFFNNSYKFIYIISYFDKIICAPFKILVKSSLFLFTSDSANFHSLFIALVIEKILYYLLVNPIAIYL